MAKLKIDSKLGDNLIATKNDIDNKIITHESKTDIHVTQTEKIHGTQNLILVVVMMI